ncbi:MAG TPA: hypothetical protein DEH22_01980 [Chloroflexi bacterium]|nr:hypothetical protein [Chloroflexota bacterium]
MPVGGCDLGANVWMEDNAIYFYFGRSNSFDENNALLKSGRVKIDFSPNPFVNIAQELKLEHGYVEIRGNSGDLSARAKIWVEVDRPMLHVEVFSNRKISTSVEYQNWRYQRKLIHSRWGVPGYMDYPGDDIFWYLDVLKTTQNQVIFYHQNNNDDLLIDKEIVQQDLSHLKDALWNPTRDFVFGGVMQGKNLIVTDKGAGVYLGTDYESLRLETKEASRTFQLDVCLHSGYYQSGTDWEDAMFAALPSTEATFEAQFARHQNWWHDFWEKSYIIINPEAPNPADPVWQVGRNYNIFRYQMACNARGEYPTKFNGGLFTVDPVLIGEEFSPENPDFRAWGGGVMTAQNQRLLYWPLLKTGDFETMLQEFDFYRRPLKNAEMRTQAYWGHEGACFTDQMSQAAIVSGREYGWDRPVDLERGVQSSPYHEYYFTSQLEFAFMVLEYYRYSRKDIRPYMPFVKSAVRFFDEHYQFRARQHFGQPFSEDGKYIFYPCMALETYTGNVRNPADVIAALTVLTRELQRLPAEYVADHEKAYYARLSARLPEIPWREMEGHRTIAPAEKWDRIVNYEIPQLYPVFPWGLYGVGEPDLQLAIDTWEYGVDTPEQKDYISWHQDAIFCARMGLTDEAARISLQKLRDADRRFPTFWGPGHDWVPDHNWGGSGMIGLQEMLLQATDEKIILFPAWPKEWDVDFKLFAPGKTTVAGSLRSGKIVKLEISPETRMKDVIL